MSKQTGLYLGQSTLKGRITQTALSQEGFTSSWTATIFDAHTGEARTLDTTGPIIITFDPQNKKGLGVEEALPESWAVASGTYTFTNTLRGISKDAHDDAGDYDNAKEWPVGTEFGITTSPQNQNYLKDLLDGSTRFRNTMEFESSQNFRGRAEFVYKPALLTCGSSPTTTAATWSAVSDGEFAFTIDGTATDITGIDFTNVGNNDQVAKVIQTTVRTATIGTEEVEWDGTQFIIRSGDTSSSSAITVLSAVSGGTGTDISGVGATAFLDGDTGNGAVTARNHGFLVTGVVVDATERDALTGVVNGSEIYVTSTGLKYDYLAGSWVSREAGGTFPNASTTIAGKVEEATDTEVRENTDAGGTGARNFINPSSVFNVTATLAGFWDMDELTGTNVADSSGNSNDGTNTNATIATGKYGKGLEFDGASGDVTVSDSAEIQNIFDGGGVIECYIEPDSDGESNVGRIINKDSGAAGWTLLGREEASGKIKLRLQYRFSGAVATWTTTATAVTLNTFSKVTLYYNASSIANEPIILVNDTVVAITEDTAPVGTRTSDVGVDLNFGNADDDSATFDGVIDEVGLWSTGDTAPIKAFLPHGRVTVSMLPQKVQEANTVFSSTDITGAELETLTNTSDAEAKHNHASADPNKYWDTHYLTVDNWATDDIGGGSKTLTAETGVIAFRTGGANGPDAEVAYRAVASNRGLNNTTFSFDDLSAGDVVVFETSLKIAATALQDVRVGFGEDSADGRSDVGSKTVAKFFLDAGVGKVVTCDGIGAVATDTFTYTNPTYGHTLRIEFTVGTSVVFKVDGTVVKTVTTNIPLNTDTGSVLFFLGNIEGEGAAKTSSFQYDPYIAIKK